MNQQYSYEQAYLREKQAREQADHLLEEKSRELYIINESLKKHKEKLEVTVERRTLALSKSNKKLTLEIECHIKTQKALEEAKIVAENANHTKSLFLANMSHELRTPLNAIIGYGEFLLEEAREKKDKVFIDCLTKITSASAHLLTLINDILDISKMEAGKLTFCVDTFSISQLIEGVVSTFRPHFQDKKNSLEVYISNDLDNMASDPVRIRQILYNLLSNACKFTEGGNVTLTASKELSNEKIWFVVQVKDTGIGISPEKIQYLFKPFVQLNDASTRIHEGAGLGLAISQSICQAMGGNITLESVVGKGSTFTMRIPLILQDIGKY